jgi:hypothetical protein
MQQSQPDRIRKAGRFAGRAGYDFYLALVIGIAIGVLLTLLLGTVLYSLGYLSIGGTPAPLPAACPPTATPPPTADLGATATAGCADFESAFPGTPCP